MRTHGPADVCLNKGTTEVFCYNLNCLRKCTPRYVSVNDRDEEVFLEKQDGPLHNPGQTLNAKWVEDGRSGKLLPTIIPKTAATYNCIHIEVENLN